jgi:hypothetical protein
MNSNEYIFSKCTHTFASIFSRHQYSAAEAHPITDISLKNIHLYQPSWHRVPTQISVPNVSLLYIYGMNIQWNLHLTFLNFGVVPLVTVKTKIFLFPTLRIKSWLIGLPAYRLIAIQRQPSSLLDTSSNTCYYQLISSNSELWWHYKGMWCEMNILFTWGFFKDTLKLHSILGVFNDRMTDQPTNSMGLSTTTEATIVRTLDSFPHFMEPEGSLPHSQELFTCPYPEPDQSSPHQPILSLQDPS